MQKAAKIQYFFYFAQGLKYSHFLIFCQPHQQVAIIEFRKGQYLSLQANIEKTKGALFPQTLIIEGY